MRRLARHAVWSLFAVMPGAIGCGAAGGSTAVATAAAPTPVSDERPQPRASEPTPVPTPAEPEPAAVEPSAPPPAFVHADLDPSNDNELGPPPPIPDCEAQLTAKGVRFKPARIGVGHEKDGVPMCGAEQVVRYKRGPGDIEYSSAPLLTCGMALALADFELVAQEVAQAELGRRIESIDHLGTYNCRKMALYDLVSEHSFANGIDLRRFHLEGGKTADVLRDFQPDQDDPPAAGRFLRRLANRLYDDRLFSVVVTPYFDRAHRNHIHIDLARYRVDGSRPSQ